MKAPIGTPLNPVLEGRFCVEIAEEYASRLRAIVSTVCPRCSAGIIFVAENTQASRSGCRSAALRLIRAHEATSILLQRDPECETCETV